MLPWFKRSLVTPNRRGQLLAGQPFALESFERIYKTFCALANSKSGISSALEKNLG
jgi:hypothetical protein